MNAVFPERNREIHVVSLARIDEPVRELEGVKRSPRYVEMNPKPLSKSNHLTTPTVGAFCGVVMSAASCLARERVSAVQPLPH